MFLTFLSSQIILPSILKFGAAEKDGRLNVHDELVSIDGIRLGGLSLLESKKTLRHASLSKKVYT